MARKKSRPQKERSGIKEGKQAISGWALKRGYFDKDSRAKEGELSHLSRPAEALYCLGIHARGSRLLLGAAIFAAAQTPDSGESRDKQTRRNPRVQSTPTSA